MSKDFILPDLGEGIAEAQIVRVLIREGEAIKEDQYLMEVETDKAAVEIPSPFSGVAKRVHVKEGQTVNVGDVIVTFDNVDGASASGGSATAAVKTAEAPAKAPPKVPGKIAPPLPPKAPAKIAPPLPPSDEPRRTTAAAAPAVRKLARVLGVDLDEVVGTGPGGRVNKDDVEKHAAGGSVGTGAARAAPARPRPQAPASLPGVPGQDKWGPIRTEPLSQIRKTIAKRMTLSAFTAVHVTHGDEADITQLDRLRGDLNKLTDNDPKLTVMSFVIRATCLCLRRHPGFNASLDQENGQVIYKDYVNMGVAVDTERGLIVPVIRDADRMSLRDIAHALRALANQVRTNQFAIEDLRGGSFTITNVGALGGTFSTPIINYPEVAILALGRSRWAPIVRNDEVTKALILPVTVSFDHRVTDGANAARFTRELVEYLTHPAKFLLE